MKYIRRHKYLFLFLLILFIIGLLFGIILFIKQDIDLKNSIIFNITNLKNNIISNRINIINHLIVVFIIIILSFIIIGFILGLFYLFLMGIVIGYSISLLVFKYGLNGLFFGVLYNIFTKFIFILIFILIIAKLLDIIRNILGYFIYHNKNIIINLRYNIYCIFLFYIILIINDLLVLISSNFVLNMISSMI